MFYDTKNNTTISKLPQHHTYKDGRTTGDFLDIDIDIQISEGFLPLIESKPKYDSRYQFLTAEEVVLSNKYATREYKIEQKSLESLRTQRYKEIDRIRDDKLSGGFYYNNTKYDSDPTAITNIQGKILSIAIGQPVEPEFVWKSADNDYIPMNADDIKISAYLYYFTGLIHILLHGIIKTTLTH